MLQAKQIFNRNKTKDGKTDREKWIENRELSLNKREICQMLIK